MQICLKKQLSDLCRRVLPVLLSIFLLSFIWIRSWSLISGIFYTAVAVGLFALNRKSLRSMRQHWPSVLFVGWFTLSLLWSPVVTVGEVADSLRYALCMLALLMIFSTPAREKIPWKWLPVAAALPALAAMLCFYLNNPVYVRLEHFGRNSIPSGGLYAFFGIIALWNLRSSDKSSSRKLNIISLTLLVGALLLTQSRGPILGFLISIAATTGLWIVRRFCLSPNQIGLTLLIALLTFPSAHATSERFDRPNTAEKIFKNRFSPRTADYRCKIWASSLNQMSGHWLTGHGLNSPYTWLKSDYAGYNLPVPMHHLHSLIFWALYHGGIVGLFLTLTLVGQAVWRACRYAFETGNRLPLALLVFGLFCSLFDGHKYLYRPRSEWIFFWIPVCYALTSPIKNDGREVLPQQVN